MSCELSANPSKPVWKKLKAKDKKLGPLRHRQYVRATYKNRFTCTLLTTPTSRGDAGCNVATAKPSPTGPASRSSSTCARFACPDCGGARSSRIRLRDRRRPEHLDRSSAASPVPWTAGMFEPTHREHIIAMGVPKRFGSGCTLSTVRVDYLSQARSAGTLSGGEAHAIRLASQIGSGRRRPLRIGRALHRLANGQPAPHLGNLFQVLLGNTVIVVEQATTTSWTSARVRGGMAAALSCMWLRSRAGADSSRTRHPSRWMALGRSRSPPARPGAACSPPCAVAGAQPARASPCPSHGWRSPASRARSTLVNDILRAASLAKAAPRQGAAGGTARWRGSTISTRWSTSTRLRSAGRRDRTRDLHRGLRPHQVTLRPDTEAKVRGQPARRSPSTAPRRPPARPVPATDP